MDFLEKNLEDIIYAAMQSKEGLQMLYQRGLSVFEYGINTKTIRQLNVGNYGTADIVTVERFSAEQNRRAYLNITVYELKKKTINLGVLLQVYRYCKGIKQYLSKRYFVEEVNFKICLIGSEIDTHTDWVYMFDFELPEINVYKYNYQIDGIKFSLEELSNYALTNEGFKL